MSTALYPVTNNARATLATPDALNNTTNPVTVSVVAGQGASFPTGASFPVTISASLDPTNDPSRELAMAVRTTDSFVLTRAAAVAHAGSPYLMRNWTAEDVQQRDVALNDVESAMAALTAGDVAAVVTAFDGIFSSADTTVQAALDTIDDISAADIPVVATGFTGNLSETDTDLQTALATIDAMTVEGSGMANPMTAAGDLISGGTSGTPEALPVGDEGDVLTVVSGAPAWATPTGGSGGSTLIDEQVLASPAASVTFSAIPGTYRHLRLRIMAASNRAVAVEDATIQLNGDTGANYDSEHAYVESTTVHAIEALAGTSIQYCLGCPGTSGAANNAGISDIQFPWYAGTAWNKDCIALKGQQGTTSSGSLFWGSTLGHWRSTAAITSIVIALPVGSFVAGSRFALYGET